MLEQVPETVTSQQAAEYLQVNRKTIYRYIRDGRLTASKIGRTYRVSKRSCDLLLWAARTRDSVILRHYSGAEIDGFLAADRLDDAAQAVVIRFMPSTP